MKQSVFVAEIFHVENAQKFTIYQELTQRLFCCIFQRGKIPFGKGVATTRLLHCLLCFRISVGLAATVFLGDFIAAFMPHCIE